MFKTWLLLTTVLTVAGSISFSFSEGAEIPGQPSALRTRIEFESPGRDRNRDFLCTYGYKVSFTNYGHSGERGTEWRHYAVPIRGKGAYVSEIAVTNSPSAGFPGFEVGIHENTNGKPGLLIPGAKGKGKALGACQSTTVVIPRTFLEAGKKYWVQADARRTYRRTTNAVSWGYNPNARHNAYYQDYFSASGSASLSQWLPVSGPAPFASVK